MVSFSSLMSNAFVSFLAMQMCLSHATAPPASLNACMHVCCSEPRDDAIRLKAAAESFINVVDRGYAKR